MKHLMLTTALVATATFGAHAQTATDGAASPQGMVPAFLASDFTGMTLYTLDSESARNVGAQGTDTQGGAMSRADQDRQRWASSDTFLAERDSWNDIGAIDNIVMTQDGEVRGILVDIGGFLGFGARTVMVDIEDLYFVSDATAPEDIADFSVVIAMTEDQLETLPEWDGDLLRTGFDVRPYRQGDTAAATENGLNPHPAADASMDHTGESVFGADYTMLEGDERTVNRLLGAGVYDAAGDNIGSVDDVIVDDDNRITSLLVDVGGFLGMGAHTVELPIETAEIGWRDADGDVRVQVSLGRDELESLPEHDS